MRKNILLTIVILALSSIVEAKEPNKMLWMLKSYSLVTKDDLYTYQVEIYRYLGVDHGADVVNVKLYKGDTNIKPTYEIPLELPGIKGYVRDISFKGINRDRVVISFDIEMKAMDDILLKEVVIVGINGKARTVIDAKEVDLYQNL